MGCIKKPIIRQTLADWIKRRNDAGERRGKRGEVNLLLRGFRFKSNQVHRRSPTGQTVEIIKTMKRIMKLFFTFHTSAEYI